MNQRGFTLLEVVVAIAIFSLLGLATYQLLDRVMRSDQRIQTQEQQLRHLQRALGLLERDLIQAQRHALKDDHSQSQALVSQPQGLRVLRGGWRNPLEFPRSDLLQANHRLSDGEWLRETQGLEPGSISQAQSLLSGVELIHLRFIDGQGQAHDSWPVGSQALSLPAAVDIALNAPGYPNIRRVILLPGGTEVAEDAPGE
ncbi:type II secretion system minor pseudopilin GspJ [Pseudomonas sp. Au-Pse12]|uniref:type II secretion system minor pseudopilin GspJ n=1 Tax=Pseudomonas sp. Au-Pse12 TaxID=2906459 RepID=UPI001E3019FE|nr:type II secretion system minor pseudopilin GspJ [Pseudomonas sp. Au-Pse12]MCE4057114.1 type II secretion system minor pseudopilin GspJ [Pseudomonas sp. Au-Pse12]